MDIQVLVFRNAACLSSRALLTRGCVMEGYDDDIRSGAAMFVYLAPELFSARILILFMLYNTFSADHRLVQSVAVILGFKGFGLAGSLVLTLIASASSFDALKSGKGYRSPPVIARSLLGICASILSQISPHGIAGCCFPDRARKPGAGQRCRVSG